MPAIRSTRLPEVSMFAAKRRPRVHLICNAHLDPVWQWRWQEGCAEALSTFRAAHALLSEHDGFIFNHNESLLYNWVREHDPHLFEEIRRWVAKGRWAIAGGWYLQPDVNLPGLEALNRHIAVGRRFFLDHFGASPRVAYNFDSFGHTGGLPQLLRRWGYELYVFMRPDASCLDLPDSLFMWRGADGTGIPAYRISIGLYHTERDNLARRVEEGIAGALERGEDVPVFWGLGNHGGGATRGDLEILDGILAADHGVDIVHSTTESFLDAVRHRFDALPVVEGDLQRIFTGCYASLSRLKRQARRSLGRLVQAEALCSAASWMHGHPFDASGFRAAWEKHLFNDFHDILPGSCTAPAEQDALDLYGEVAESVRRMRFGAAARMAQAVDVDSAVALPLTVLSSSSGRQPVEFECMMDHRPLPAGDWHARLHRIDGEEIACQEEQPAALLPFNGWRRRISFVDDLPALGAMHYRVDVVRGKASRGPAPVHGSSPILPVALVMRDNGDSWGSGLWEFRDVAGTFAEKPGSRKTIESGPVRTIVESVLAFGHSRIVLHVVQYPDLPVVEYRFRVHWNEERRMLKLEFPLDLAKCAVECEVPGGGVARAADGQEHVQGRWLVARGSTADGKAQAVGFANNGQHGFDFHKGVLRITAMRSAAYCHERGMAISESPARTYMDQGVHDIRILVTQGGIDDVRRRMPGLAQWIDAPPVAFPHLPLGAVARGKTDANDAAHANGFAGRVPRETEALPFAEHGGLALAPAPAATRSASSLLDLSPSNVGLLACKLSRDGNALVLRVHEAAGLPTAMSLRIFEPDVRIEHSLGPHAFATFRVERDGAWREIALSEDL